MATYKMYEEETERERQKREKIEIAKEEIRIAKARIAKIEANEEEAEDVDTTEVVENMLGFVILVGFGLMVLYRYIKYGFI